MPGAKLAPLLPLLRYKGNQKLHGVACGLLDPVQQLRNRLHGQHHHPLRHLLRPRTSLR
jgi:hypothetical protein